MSQIKKVIKNKNRIAKENKKRRTKELRELKENAMYRSRLAEDMQVVRMILEDEEVSQVVIYLGNEKLLSMFLKAMYSEELADYTVTQIDTTHFAIGRKIINF